MDLARYRCEELFKDLGIRFRRSGKMYAGRCPVHGGKRYQSFNFYPDGRNGRAFWCCRSNHCEEVFCGNIVGFIRGVLSHQQYSWTEKGDTEVTFQDALNYLCQFLKLDWKGIKPDYNMAEIQAFSANIDALTAQQAGNSKRICTRERIRNFLRIPAEYYLNRGYRPETLNAYDIGLCECPQSELYGRVVIPFYDSTNKYVIGCIGRTTHPQCPECRFYHHLDIPCRDVRQDAANYGKIKSLQHFKCTNILYNYWNAQNHILDTRSVVVVEGAADVWKLVESGVTNAVALNGSNISEPQVVALECSGATEIICLTDNDEAGERAYEQIAKKCWFAKVIRPAYDGKDIGEMDLFTLKQHQFHKYIRDKLSKINGPNNNRDGWS